MSITTTVYIPEGITMAADSRLTGTTTYGNGTVDRHTLSDNSQKLFLIKNNSIGIACCGDATIAGKSVGDFLRQFEIDRVHESDTIISVARKLNEYTISMHGAGVIYQLAGYLNDEPYVYAIIDNILRRENIGDQGDLEYGFTWQGVGEAISKLVLGDPKMQFNFGLMQLKDGIDLAEFLVDVTIKYQRFDMRLATCGGAIDSLVITKDYSKFIKHKVLNP